MIEGYAQQQMPGDPLESLVQLRDRLDNLIRVVTTQRSRHDVSVQSSSKMAQAHQAATSAGVTEEQWTQFVDKEGVPPGCYERTCWWLKKVTKTFGPDVGEAVATAVLDEEQDAVQIKSSAGVDVR